MNNADYLSPCTFAFDGKRYIFVRGKQDSLPFSSFFLKCHLHLLLLKVGGLIFSVSELYNNNV